MKLRIFFRFPRAVSLFLAFCLGPAHAAGAQQAAASSAETPQLVAQLRALDAVAVAFSPDGLWLANGNQLWDVRSRKLVRIFTARQSLKDAAFSPDGKLLAGLGDKAVIVWQVSQSTPLQTLQTAQETPTCLAFQPGAGRLAVGCASGKICLWDIRAKQSRILNIGSQAITDLGFNATGGTLAASTNSGVVVMNLGTGTRRLLKHPTLKSVASVAIDPQGKYVAAGSENGLVLWEVPSGNVRGTFPHSGQVRFTKDGRTLLNLRNSFESLDGQLTLGNSIDYLDPHTAQRYASITRSYGIERIAVDPRNEFIAGSSFGSIVLFSLANRDDNSLLQGHGVQVTTLACDHKGQLFALGAGPRIVLWDASKGRTLRSFSLGTQYGEHATALFFSPSDETLYACTAQGLRRWRLTEGTELEPLRKASPDPRSSPDYYDIYYEAAAISRDGSRVFGLRNLRKSPAEITGSLECGKVDVWEAAFQQKLLTFGDTQWTEVKRSEDSHTFWKAALRADDQRLATSRLNEDTVQIWDAVSGRLLNTLSPHAGQVFSLAYSTTDNLLAVGCADGSVQLWADDGARPLGVIQGHASGVSALAFTPDGKSLISGNENGFVTVWNVTTRAQVRTLGQMEGYISEIALSSDGKLCLAASADGTVHLWKVAEGTLLLALVPTEAGEVLAATPEGYYASARNATQAVAFRVGNRAYPFEQFDLRLNRPDKVLETLGSSDQALLSFYRAAYHKRLEKMGFTEASFSNDFHLPDPPSLTPALPLTTNTGTLAFTVSASDTLYPLDRVNVWVNDVPVPRIEAARLREQVQHHVTVPVRIDLTPGRNKVQVSVLNRKGAESLRETWEVTYTPQTPAPKPRLWVLCIGVSQYQDSRYLLRYAAKDAQDVANLLASHQDKFASVNKHTLLDDHATKEQILQEKDWLSQSGVDDEVVVFVAGHGMLDAKLDYYFGTVDMNFEHPEQKGLSYEQLESLLDGIAARKKLLLMDTCHAGEVDKEGDGDPQKGLDLPPGVTAIPGSRGVQPANAPRVGLQDSFALMQQLFVDLRRGNGAQVIASAAGQQYALEREGNGVFTAALLEGLRAGKTKISELSAFVAQRVAEQTHGRQIPTTRQENVEFDWNVF